MTPRPAIHVSRRRSRAAFTLIELLTVIAIIGILAAILIPTISKVRQSAKNAQCTATLREWGRCVQLYANENKGNYVIWNTAKNRYWHDAGTNPYTVYFGQQGEEAARRMRVCGMDPAPDAAKLDFALCRGSINGNIDTVASDKAVPLGKARNPSQLLLVVDASENGADSAKGIFVTGVSDMTRLNTFVGPMLDATLATDSAKDNAARHGGNTINGVFADGSVKRITGTPAGQGDNRSIFEMRTTWFLIY